MIMTRPNRPDRMWTGFDEPLHKRRIVPPQGGRATRDTLRGSRILDAQIKRDARIHRTAWAKTVKRTIRTGFVLLFCLSLIALLLFVFARIFLVVREVRFSGLATYQEEEILGSGIVPDQGFLYGIDKAGVQSALTLRYPMIKSVSISRSLPSTLEITVEEEKPSYYTRISGEYYLISNDLRAVGRAADRAALEAAGYREIVLPPVKRAITGRPLVFEQGVTTGYVRSILELVDKSPLAGRVTGLEATDKFELTLMCDGIYRVCLGDGTDAAVKMMVAAKILEDELFTPGVGATIDVRNPKQARVIMGSY